MRLKDFRKLSDTRRRLGSQAVSDVVTINLPHRDTPDLVEAVLPLWALQTVPTEIHVIDTGSIAKNLERVRVACEKHGALLFTLPAREWRHASENVAVACDLSQASCQSEKLLFSHVDVFPRRRDLVAELAERCQADAPVVGYEISPRDEAQGKLAQLWRGMVGHSLTIAHVPTLRRLGITWGFDRAFEFYGFSDDDRPAWDTEVSFNLALRAAGIAPVLIGHDENRTHLVDGRHGHARSYPGSTIHHHQHALVAREWVDQEIAEAAERVRQWTTP